MVRGILNGELVAVLGLFHEGGLGRYQSVETHPYFRKTGICGTLVYETGLIGFDDFGVHQLVMEADPHYNAARIYESVRFAKSETTHSLSWWKR